jgi:hypothetical protein
VLRIIVFSGLLFLVTSAISLSQSPTCSDERGARAEREASTLDSWNAVYRSYLEYQGCDDGAIAEGYSESISRLLAQHWDQLPDLLNQINESPAFGTFIVKHVDETVPSDRLRSIVVKARDHCPSGARKFCMRLAKAAR